MESVDRIMGVLLVHPELYTQASAIVEDCVRDLVAIEGVDAETEKFFRVSAWAALLERLAEGQTDE